MIPKFRVFDSKFKEMEEVYLIDWQWPEQDAWINDNPSDNLIFMQSTGVNDKHGVEIFEGDIIQQVHAYDYDKLEIETDYLEPFEVKKGNYTQGKWVAEEIDEKHYSVVRYVFGKDVKVIGNVHENPELLGE